MWLPLILLALMASGSACPDLCVCHRSAVERDFPTLVHVKCHGRAPGLSELPVTTKSLSVDGAEEYDVIGFFDELEVTDSLNDFEVIGTLNEFDANDTLNKLENGTTILPYLDQLSVTNCSLVFLNASWHGFERLTALNLSCNNLPRLNDALLGRTMNMSELTRFDLSDNSLTKLSAAAFRTLARLVKLSLRRNAITIVHENAFQGLDRLEFLDLSDNRLADLPDSALTPLCSLQKLDLSGNQLQVLGARWFESLDRLRELDVSRNGLARAASGTLQPLPGLSVLKLSENPLKERDVSLLLGTGRRLETVDASRTGLARVPAALTRSVRTLRLAGNKLTTIRGGDLDSYPLLRMLDISENRLIDIEDDALGRLEVLEELDISGNALVKVPGSLPNNLTNLKLHRNAITALKIDNLQGLYNLKCLTLNDNNINEIEVGALGQLPDLKELDLSDNPIKTLPANTLSGPSNLAKLRMSGLTSLQRKQEEQSDMAFPVPTPERLVYLDVSRSPVLARQLLADDAALSACKSLIELNLSETNLTGLRFDLSYMLPQLRTLDLSGNDWDCTEDLYWLGEWLRQYEELNKDTEPGECTSPQELSGSFLRELPSPPSPLPTTVPTTISSVSVTPPTLFSMERSSDSIKANVSSNVTGINAFNATDRPVNESISTNVSKQSASTGSSHEIDSSHNVTGNPMNIRAKTISALLSDGTRLYEAPTSFRNITTSIEEAKERNISKKATKVDNTLIEVKNSIRNVAGLSYRTEKNKDKLSITEDDSDSQTFDNRVGGDKQGGKRPKKLDISTTKMASLKKLSKYAALEEEEQGEKKTTEKYSNRVNNLIKEENLVLGNPPDSNTIAEELNSRATDSDARVSEALSAGAHPGMLVLVVAAFGAAAALTVVLSRRATVRRRDKYHRHENIEVHTLTPTAELW